jgi:hypothetical protein
MPPSSSTDRSISDRQWRSSCRSPGIVIGLRPAASTTRAVPRVSSTSSSRKERAGPARVLDLFLQEGESLVRSLTRRRERNSTPDPGSPPVMTARRPSSFPIPR